MFLCLTRDKRFWDDTLPRLYLGAWCETWSEPKCPRLPYHWDNREKYFEDSLKLDSLYHAILPSLGWALNGLNGTTHSHRYWEILCGPWLFHFVGIVWDRYEILRTAKESGLVTRTWIPEAALFEEPAFNTGAFIERAIRDPFNQSLFGEILKKTGGIDFEMIPTEKEKEPTLAPPSFAKQLARLPGQFSRFFPRRYQFCTSYFPKGLLAKLEWSLGDLPNLDLAPPLPEIPAMSWKSRLKLAKSLIFTHEAFPKEFLALLQDLLPKELPLIFLEGHAALKEASQTLPRKANVIVSTNAHLGNETFMAWAAAQADAGSQLLFGQHGGHTGTGKWCQSEAHEVKTADLFLTWGWEESRKTTAIPAAKLLRPLPPPQENGQALLVLNSFPRYFYRSYSIPVAGQALDYLQDQFTFVENLNAATRDRLKVRLYPSEFGWQESAQWATRFPDLRLSTEAKFLDDLKNTQICISPHNTTTYLETLSANFPTLAYWNEAHWELRESALPYFQALKDAKILFSCPKAAALHLNEVLPNLATWWQSEAVQNARVFFCDRYARTSANPLSVWKAVLKNAAAPIHHQILSRQVTGSV